MHLNFTESLPDRVENQYQSAKSSGDLIFSETELCLVRDSHGYPVRFCPALSVKPVSIAPPPSSAPKKPFDPFAVPSPELFITPVPNGPNATYNLILNKFPIIPHHLILATKGYAKQDDLLEISDLEATYALLKEWPNQYNAASNGETKALRRLFAFFNSGPHSGASQPHRHVQFLPVEAMLAGTDSESLLIDWLPEGMSKRDFAIFMEQIPPAVTAEQLHKMYLKLHSQAQATARPGPGEQLSYNLALTTERMVVCPRRAESAGLSSQGLCGFNGASLAGTMLTKTREQYDTLRGDNGAEILSGMLKEIGFAP